MSITRDAIAAPSPRPHLTLVLAPCPLSLSLSLLAALKSPFACKCANVTPAPWCAPQVCANSSCQPCVMHVVRDTSPTIPCSASDFDHRRSFRPRACCCALTCNTVTAFILNTGPFFAYEAAHSVASRTHSLSTSLSFSPISLCVAYTVLLRTRPYIYPSPALLKGSQIGPVFSYSLLCAFWGNCSPFLISSSPSLRFLVPLII